MLTMPTNLKVSAIRSLLIRKDTIFNFRLVEEELTETVEVAVSKRDDLRLP